MNIITVAIADDHVIFRKGLRTILDEINDLKVIGEASNGEEIISILEKNDIDVVLMDIRMPLKDGIEATKEIKLKFPKTRIIALTMHEEIGYFNQMIEAGADGFLLKKTTKDELEMAISTVMKGKYFFSQEFAAYADKQYPQKLKTNDYGISEREIEVLELICKGFSNPDISKKLNISVRTVDGHRARLFEKTGAKNAPHLVLFAVQHGLIKM